MSINNELATVTNTDSLPESSQLITLKPEKYVAEVYRPFMTSLKKAIREHGKLIFDPEQAGSNPEYFVDIQTTKGITIAKAMRAAFREIRTSAENTRKERKAPIIEIGKLIDTKYKELETEIRVYENKADEAIKAEEKRKEDEKQRLIEIERARIEAIENRIATIRNAPLRFMESSSEDIEKAIQKHSDMKLDPADYEEHLEDALNVVNATIVKLTEMKRVAVAKEEAAAQAERERLELERLRRESEERERAEAERRAAEERAKQEAEARQKEAERVQAEQMAAMQAQMAEMQKQLAASQAALLQATAPATEEKPVEVASITAPINSTGQYYSTSTFKDNGEPILCNPDGTRSVFCDIADGDDVTAPEVEAAPVRPSDDEIMGILTAAFGVDTRTMAIWLQAMVLENYHF